MTLRNQLFGCHLSYMVQMRVLEANQCILLESSLLWEGDRWWRRDSPHEAGHIQVRTPLALWLQSSGEFTDRSQITKGNHSIARDAGRGLKAGGQPQHIYVYICIYTAPPSDTFSGRHRLWDGMK